MAAGCFHPILAGASIERWWGGLSGPRAGVYKANSCVIVSRAWENVPLAGRWRDLTPEPLVKKDLCAPRQHCDANEAPARCWTWCWLFFFLSLERFFFPFSFFFLFFFLVACLWENLLRCYSVKLINQAPPFFFCSWLQQRAIKFVGDTESHFYFAFLFLFLLFFRCLLFLCKSLLCQRKKFSVLWMRELILKN